MRLPLVAAALTAVLAPAATAARPRTVIVPRVVGLRETTAQCALAKHGLRWRFRGQPGTYGVAVPCETGVNSSPDPAVISQSLRPHRHVRYGTFVTLDDECLQAFRLSAGRIRCD